MINVIYQMVDDRCIYLSVKGHAEFAEYGKDLICASVSSIMFGLMNALDQEKQDVEIKELTNHIEIINKSKKDKLQEKAMNLAAKVYQQAQQNTESNTENKDNNDDKKDDVKEADYEEN